MPVQAGWHLAGELSVPTDMRLIFLPPYSPEINPAEHLWKSLRKDCFASHVFADLDAVERTLSKGLVTLEANSARTQSVTGFQWITSICLLAKKYQRGCNRLAAYAFKLRGICRICVQETSIVAVAQLAGLDSQSAGKARHTLLGAPRFTSRSLVQICRSFVLRQK